MNIKVLSVKNIVTPKGVKILTVGTQGATGLSGNAASTSLTLIAGEPLDSLRAVISVGNRCFYASNLNNAHMNKVIGITTQTVSSNSTVFIQSSLELNGFGGLIASEPVYLHDNGIISSLLPTSGFIQHLGIALSASKIVIQIQPAIALL